VTFAGYFDPQVHHGRRKNVGQKERYRTLAVTGVSLDELLPGPWIPLPGARQGSTSGLRLGAMSY